MRLRDQWCKGHHFWENALAVLYILTDVTDRGYIGGKRTWRDGGE